MGSLLVACGGGGSGGGDAQLKDAWAYFARRYGLAMGAVIQPVNFAEPSAAEVAGIVDDLKAERVPAFFGSVTPR